MIGDGCNRHTKVGRVASRHFCVRASVRAPQICGVKDLLLLGASVAVVVVVVADAVVGVGVGARSNFFRCKNISVQENLNFEEF